MKTELVASVGLSAVAVVLKDITFGAFGLPVGAVVAAGGGALFGMAYMPAQSSLSRGWAAAINAFASCCLTGLVAHLASINASAALSGVAFVIAASPVFWVKLVQSRLGVKNDAG